MDNIGLNLAGLEFAFCMRALNLDFGDVTKSYAIHSNK